MRKRFAPGYVTPAESRQRNLAIMEAYKGGKNFQRISEDFGISRERVRQIIFKETQKGIATVYRTKVELHRVALRRLSKEFKIRPKKIRKLFRRYMQHISQKGVA
jgi:transposase